MEKHIKDKFTDDILAQARAFYGIAPEEIRLLDGFESFIFEFDRGDEEYILRISHSNRRSEKMINGEVDFINYLVAHGVGASEAIQSDNGKLVESIADGHGEFFLTTAFKKAKGGTYTKENWKPTLWQEYGRQVGKMNRLAQSYEVSKPEWARAHWDDKENLDAESWIPADQPMVLQRYQELYSHLNTLPREITVYGMIHQDAHGGNMFVDEDGKITFFDFDDCCLGWYAYDLAMVLFYAIPFHGETVKLATKFLTEFLIGYREEFEIDEFWLSQLPHFLKLREIDLYAVLYRDMGSYDPENAWIKSFLDGRREKIEAGVPFLDMDFTQFA